MYSAGRAVKSAEAREYIDIVRDAFDAQATIAEREALPTHWPRGCYAGVAQRRTARGPGQSSR